MLIWRSTDGDSEGKTLVRNTNTILVYNLLFGVPIPSLRGVKVTEVKEEKEEMKKLITPNPTLQN